MGDLLEDPDPLLSAPLLQQVEAIKNVLMVRATSANGNSAQYGQLRRVVLKVPAIKARVPRFVVTCRTLDEFWQLIKQQSGTYAGRRQYIQEQFADVLDYLESTDAVANPSNATADLALKSFDAEGVRAAWLLMLERRDSDPAGAITAARTLIETVCKHILDELGVAYTNRTELPALYQLVAAQLRLAPSQHAEDAFKTILGSCMNVVNTLAEIRNKVGDAHGQGKNAVRATPRHAALVVNLAGSVAEFLLATLAARRKTAG